MTNYYRKKRSQDDGFNYYLLEEKRDNGKTILVPCDKDGAIITEKPKQHNVLFEKITPEKGWEQWNVEFQQLQSAVDSVIKQPSDKKECDSFEKSAMRHLDLIANSAPQDLDIDSIKEGIYSIESLIGTKLEPTININDAGIAKGTFDLKLFDSCLQSVHDGIDPAEEGGDKIEITELKRHTTLLEKIVELLQQNTSQTSSTAAPTVDFSEVLKEVVALSETVDKIDVRTAAIAHKANKRKPTYDDAAEQSSNLIRGYFAKLNHTPLTTIDDLVIQPVKVKFKFQGRTIETQADVREIIKFSIMELTK